MLRPDQAALLSVRLSLVLHVYAGVRAAEVERRNMQVSRGENVIFTCNTTQMDNVTQIIWRTERHYYAHQVFKNETSKNVSSDRVRIDTTLPTTLTIFKTQQEDEGVYSCESTTSANARGIEWTLTVSSDDDSSWHWYIIASVAGLTFLGLISAIVLCSKCRKNTASQDLDQPREEQQLYSVIQPHAARVKNTKKRSQYVERLNSIYGL